MVPGFSYVKGGRGGYAALTRERPLPVVYVIKELINIFLFLYEYIAHPILVSKHANLLEASPCAMTRFAT